MISIIPDGIRKEFQLPTIAITVHSILQSSNQGKNWREAKYIYNPNKNAIIFSQPPSTGDVFMVNSTTHNGYQ